MQNINSQKEINPVAQNIEKMKTNRRIDFRGLDQNGVMQYGDFVCNAMHGCAILVVTELPPTMSDPCGDTKFEYITVPPETVGQFTGLADKNGKDIYEDDLIKDKFDNQFTVEFRLCQFVRVMNGERDCNLVSSSSYLELEINGNIHQNPDLIL